VELAKFLLSQLTSHYLSSRHQH